MEYLQYRGSAFKANIIRKVLNLIINGIPSIRSDREWTRAIIALVLNLVISGIPSIPRWNNGALSR